MIDGLTPAEQEIARMVAAGLRARDIAKAHGTSEGTVKMHLRNIYRKLDLRGGSPAAKLAAKYAEYRRRYPD